MSTDSLKRKLTVWMFKGVREAEGPHEKEGQHHQHTWWRVMCLTGVDYFSTLGYQPGIAFLAAQYLSPIATIVLVLLTLFGALPIYRRVAEESPHGEGSISMLENLLSRWKGKLLVLALLGFVATDFIITITLSAADATAHILENPFVEHHIKFLHHRIIVTLILIGILGAVFLKGFKEAIGIAVFLVGLYILLNLVVISFGLYEVVTHPTNITDWKNALFSMDRVRNSYGWMLVAALFVFPKLALGLSGFETGVAVMPLVKGERDLTAEEQESIHATKSPHRTASPNVSDLLQGRIENTKKLLLGAALAMSVLLIASSFITAILIPAEAFQPGGQANGRAISFLAHRFFGDGFGTVYDVSTIMILWFAGASAMAGLLNIVPRYLPRYGMAPDWTRATRPLVMVYTAIAFSVTIWFEADVDKQGGAYATGVLVLMTSAAVAVTLAARRRKKNWLAYLLISLIFAYTTIVNVFERPDGVKIASFFIGAIIVTSLFSRVWRTTELRFKRVQFDELALAYITEAASYGDDIRIVANRLDSGDEEEYRAKVEEQLWNRHIQRTDHVLFLEVAVGDASEFGGNLAVCGAKIGNYRVLRTESPVVPNAIAAVLLKIRDTTGKLPHVYFGWSEGNPITYLLKYIAFGEGDTAPVTHEVLRQAERKTENRPVVHVGGR